MKVTRPEGSLCFVATLNTSDSALPTAVLDATSTVSNDYHGDDDGYTDTEENGVIHQSLIFCYL